jgi:hypothetical protein
VPTNGLPLELQVEGDKCGGMSVEVRKRGAADFAVDTFDAFVAACLQQARDLLAIAPRENSKDTWVVRVDLHHQHGATAIGDVLPGWSFFGVPGNCTANPASGGANSLQTGWAGIGVADAKRVVNQTHAAARVMKPTVRCIVIRIGGNRTKPQGCRFSPAGGIAVFTAIWTSSG